MLLYWEQLIATGKNTVALSVVSKKTNLEVNAEKIKTHIHVPPAEHWPNSQRTDNVVMLKYFVTTKVNQSFTRV